MGNDTSRANDENSFTGVVDNAIRSATPSIFGDSSVRSFGSLIDSAIRSSTASSTDADFDHFEITFTPSQQEQAQAQAQQDRVTSPPPRNTINFQQPLLQTEETIRGVPPPLFPLNTGFTSTSMSKSAYDTNSNRRNSSASVSIISWSEDEILQSPKLKKFSFNELKAATRNFRPYSVTSVYKGWIDEKSLAASRPGKGMPVAVKLLNIQGHREWLTEINYLGQLQHPNLVRLIGYCLEDEYRLLVYEFAPKGSLENHLFRRGSYSEPFSWSLRMNIALGAAKGLAFIHSSEPKVIHRNFKTSKILLDTNYNVKLYDFGLARDGPTGDESHFSISILGTYGYAAPDYAAPEYAAPEYAAPEYVSTVYLTTKSDVYSFGVVLLEMISGRRAIDKNRPTGEQNLVQWAKPYLLNRKRVFQIMDPHLEGEYSQSQAQAAAALSLQCLAVDHKHRPNMDEVVKALEKLHERKQHALKRWRS